MFITHNFHKQINTPYVNKCSERNFYCPKNIDDKVSVYKDGGRIINLNGEYEFAFFKKGEPFSLEKKFETVIVPKVWQCYNKGQTCYVNDHYLIDLDYDNFKDSSYGVYRKTCNINKQRNKRYYINFEGKDSCLYLYVNKTFVGFDSVAHSTSEFDITDYLIDGNNEFIIFVYQFSIGTYFECQDKFRLSGLFRDVYILIREEQHIESYSISYKKINQKDIEVTIDFVSPKILKNIKVLNTNINISTFDNNISFIFSSPKLWNAEEPNLYTLSIQANNEQIYDYLSFRFVELKNNVLYLNNKKIKLLGVNHHDSKYETGYYLSLEDYRNDVLLMKQAYMNAVRTSHYPPAPEFLYLCDEYGLYVMDEADIECHGSVWKNGEYNINDIDYFTDNEKFDCIIKDRIDRLYSRDKNRQCVLFWSGGNEAGFGKVMIKYLKYLKEKDSSRLIHYESLYTSSPERNNYHLDMISQMYTSIDKIKETLKNNSRPIILCEYCHAMGNSCGDIHDYVNFFYQEERLMGGFIWEFNDHLFPINGDLNKPGYGGDFLEPLHSGNFCVDGLINYKRQPTTNYLEVKAAYAHLQVIKENNSYYLISRYDFINKANIKIILNGKEFGLYSIKPKEKIFITSSQEKILNFDIYINDKLYSSNTYVNKTPQFKINLLSDGIINKFSISNNHFHIKISPQTGLIEEVYYDNKKIINHSKLRMLRAPIDNDQYEIDTWKKQGIYDYKVILEKTNIVHNKLECFISCNPVSYGKITYQIENNKFLMTFDFNIDEKVSYLPRFGLDLFINKEYEKYSYLGYGPYESYCDKKNLDKYGEFNEIITKEINYIKPQECYSHLAEKICLNNISFEGFNSFSYLPYSIEELMKKKHSYELQIDKENNHLILDYMMTGVGSHACGPELDKKYKLTAKKIKYSILMEVK